ncbi:MAG: hypothetical protein AAGK00_13435 [Pseudomonadota bacterium]
MNDRIISELRWQEYKRAMLRFYVDSLADCMALPTRFFVIRGAVGRDRKHYLRFPAGPHIDHDIDPGRTHAAATQLKLAGDLDPLVHALMDDDMVARDRVLAEYGEYLHQPARPG